MRLQANHMSALGIANTMKLAYAYNRIRFRHQDAWRKSLYREQFASLLEENGAPVGPKIQMQDGWAIDTSQSLPHLDRILLDGDKVIADHGGVRSSVSGAYRSFFQDVWAPSDAEDYPSYLDFATSSDVLATVGDYLQCVPVLSRTLPPGIRVVESNAAFDDRPTQPHDSQLYHIDYYARPGVYVIVLLRDTARENGPFTFLPRTVSERAARALNYHSRRRGYRVSDQEIYSVIDRKEVVEFCGRRGTVLFIDASKCFHYGSRNAVKPRFLLMLAYTGTYRTDFSEVFMQQIYLPARASDSRLRRLVLDKKLLT
jgi:hypothetical protein